MAQRTEVFMERRVSRPDDSIPTPGIARILRQASEAHGEHDKMWWRKDPSDHYSLLQHCQDVSAVTTAISEFWGRDEHWVSVACIAGLKHDDGKLDESCWNYRLPRPLTQAEKASVDRHGELSGDNILECSKRVRPEERVILEEAYPPVRFHHSPEKIRHPVLRQIGFELMGADMYVSLKEYRAYRVRVYTPRRAMKKTLRRFRQMAEDPAYEPFLPNIMATTFALKELYNMGIIS